MKLASLSSLVSLARARARYLVLVLPAFALVSTVQSGCSNTSTGYGYGYGYGGKRSSSTVAPDPGSDCTTVTRYYGGYVSTTNCDDDDGYYGR